MHFWLSGLAGFLLMVFGACNTPGNTDQPGSDRTPAMPLEINIANDSMVDFDSVVVAFPSQRESYGSVAAGGQSDYRIVEQAYRYAYVEAHTAETLYVHQPIDYTGENLLGSGRYTYALNLEQGELTLKLVER